MITNRLLFTALAIFFLSVPAAQDAAAQIASQATVLSKAPKAQLTESQKIEELILSLKGMKNAVFVRNGSEHSSQEAAEHLKTKWKKHSDKIKTAEDFIEHLATKSSMTGELYMIRLADGKKVPAGNLLHNRLKQLEQ